MSCSSGGFTHRYNMTLNANKSMDFDLKIESSCLIKSDLEKELTYSKCHDAILKSDIKSDILLFYFNVMVNATRSVYSLLYSYFFYILFTVILVLALYVVYKSYWNPILYKKELTEVGFDHIPPGPDRLARIARSQSARRIGSKIPPPYPNGWFAIAESRELKIGSVISVDALGQNLCVYRGEDGVARCTDAYCPHLGANIAIGGSICGNCIVCPFHKWKFGADGACISVPGVEHAPKGVSIKTWTTVEADGAVWIWHDAEGREPLWELEDAPEVKNWGYRGRNEYLVNAHVEEIPENAADVEHLNAIHSPSMLSNLGKKYPELLNIIGQHIWTAKWSRNEDHTASLQLTHDYKVMNMKLFHVVLDGIQIGPGHVRLRLETPVGPALISQSVTPIGPLLQKVIHRVYTPNYNAPMGAAFVVSEGHMIERDFPIWNNKRFVGAPTYVRLDKMIRAFRTWYSQFYSEKSLSFKEAIQNPYDW